MKVVIQRAANANVIIDNIVHAEIDQGLVVLLGIENEDTMEDVMWLVAKIVSLRIFSDTDDKMNMSVIDIKGCILVISQFTLYASTKKGNRPSFIRAARPEKAIPLYESFIDTMKIQSNLNVKSGIFGADMKVSLVNDGPVTIIIDSKNKE